MSKLIVQVAIDTRQEEWFYLYKIMNVSEQYLSIVSSEFNTPVPSNIVLIPC